jgi:beta-N-acetylhexosaminidase
LLERLSETSTPTAFVHFGSPYLLSAVPDLPSYILAYDDHSAAEVSVVKAVLGAIPFLGKLPVSLPGAYPVGHSILR